MTQISSRWTSDNLQSKTANGHGSLTSDHFTELPALVHPTRSPSVLNSSYFINSHTSKDASYPTQTPNDISNHSTQSSSTVTSDHPT